MLDGVNRKLRLLQHPSHMTSFTTNGNVSRDLNSKSSSKGFSQGKMSTPGMPIGHSMPQVSGISTGGGGIKVSSILGGTH